MEFLSAATFDSLIDYVQLGFKLAQEMSSMTEEEIDFVQKLFTGTLEETINAAHSLSYYVSLQTIVQLKSNLKFTNPTGKLGTVHVNISQNWSKTQRARKRLCIAHLKTRPRIKNKIECRTDNPLQHQLRYDPNEMFAMAKAKCDMIVIV